MAKRELIKSHGDARHPTRRERSHQRATMSVARCSGSADWARTGAKSGQGDKGDRRR